MNEENQLMSEENQLMSEENQLTSEENQLTSEENQLASEENQLTSECEVYRYNIPKVSEDGKQSIPVPDSQAKKFPGLDEAKAFAAESKTNFDRVVLMQEGHEGQKMFERYRDGEYETPDTIVRR